MPYRTAEEGSKKETPRIWRTIDFESPMANWVEGYSQRVCKITFEKKETYIPDDSRLPVWKVELRVGQTKGECIKAQGYALVEIPTDEKYRRNLIRDEHGRYLFGLGVAFQQALDSLRKMVG